MRLIRDILNEKRAAAERPQTTPVDSGIQLSKASPYVLRTPAEPETTPHMEHSTPAPQADVNDAATPQEDDPLFDEASSEEFFRKVSEEMQNPDVSTYEEETMGADTTAHGLMDNFEDDDDEDYEDDDPDFDADAMEAEFDLDDFAPSAVAQEAAAALNAPDPFDRLDSTAPAAAATTPSPLKSAMSHPQTRPQTPAAEEFAKVPPAAQQPMPSAPQAPVDTLSPVGAASENAPVDMPAPAAGRGSNRSGRVKTRLLGFSAEALQEEDPFQKAESKADGMFPVGWLVVVSEMGRGSSYALYDGVSKVGRGEDQSVSLNFGDNSISRENHISIAYDAEQNKFFVGHSGKTNLVRINNTPLLSTQELFSKDLIRLGETTLRFVALCQSDFSWNAPEEKVARHA